MAATMSRLTEADKTLLRTPFRSRRFVEAASVPTGRETVAKYDARCFKPFIILHDTQCGILRKCVLRLLSVPPLLAASPD